MLLRLANTHVRRHTLALIRQQQHRQMPQVAAGIRSPFRIQQQIASFHHSQLRTASLPDGWDASSASHPIVQKIRENPQVMDQLVEFTMLLQKKGIDVAGKQPGFADMMKIMNDPEIKEVVKKLAQEMQAAGIQLDMQSIAEIQKSLEGYKDEEQKEGGVVNKMKGLFKK
ncbi:hypothetical protein BDB00DRAFT_795354 [Zychaea mexicana]|uniref:uncharacterized protein n=1 Tax=Zychaea mexicana TaxID=64656 RepID=UPI0022FED44F|nr:uncharacterized protein BDB00DRAFT_795354 [Zychaea mexicana]KAI9499736.1 hypothetical protein BDB00DRAFT_795354 [Zychaea mexicana]